jgi:chromate transporter
MSAAPHTSHAPVVAPTFGEMVGVFAKIGCLSFGGPAGQIALMHRELVEDRRWISEERFLHALNYCMVLPGPEAQQLATYIGWLIHGTRGGLAAGILFLVPGLILILVLSAIYALYQGNLAFDALFFGLKAAVLAIVAEAVLRVGRRSLKNRFMLGLAAASFLAIFAFHVPFPIIVLTAGLIGFFGARLRPELFKARGHEGSGPGSGVYLVLAEPVAERGILPALRTIAIWGALWVAPVLLLGSIFGWNTVFAPIAGFFSQMAVVTFGGAYAVLSYVAQAAVADFGWLKPTEMLDGLAMAETTPGPLILVLVYVGFLAAFRAPPGIDPLTSGLIGGVLTAWVTFIPCFLWIFLGAPYVEKLRGNAALSGALAAITAAVVGVILNLALWFGLHVLFRQVGIVAVGPLSISWPAWSSFDFSAGLLALIAAFAVFRLKLGMLAVLPAMALLGALVVLLRSFG